MSDVTDQIPSVRCDVCLYPFYTDNTKAKRHVKCQHVFTRAHSKWSNKLRRRRAEHGQRLNDEDRQRAYREALVDARIAAKKDPTFIELAKQDEQEAIERAWEHAKIRNAEDGYPVPEDILAYDYFGTVPEDVEEGNGGTDTEDAGAPNKGLEARLNEALNAED